MGAFVRPDCASGSATDHSVNGPVIVAAASKSALDLQNQRDSQSGPAFVKVRR